MAVLVLLVLSADPVTVVRCGVAGDAQERVYELQRSGAAATEWRLVMRSRQAGAAPVVLPLPDARPVVGDRHLALDYRTFNGGRTVKWQVNEAGAATLDVYTNFELEVNVDADLDPRVELMNTDGQIANLSCAIQPQR